MPAMPNTSTSMLSRPGFAPGTLHAHQHLL
jgi:hypothetical protein